MANWSECYIKFSGPEAKLNEIEKDAQKQNYVDYEVNESSYDPDDEDSFQDDGELAIHLSGRWSGPSEWFESVCSKYEISGVYSDAESGSNFYTCITYENGGLFERVDTAYFSAESARDFGVDYFYYHFEDCYETVEDAEETLAVFEQLGSDRRETIKFIVNDERWKIEETEESVETMEKLFMGIASIGDTSGDAQVYIQIDDVYIIEANKSKDGFVVTAFNAKTNNWIEQEIILGDILLATVVRSRDELKNIYVNNNGIYEVEMGA